MFAGLVLDLFNSNYPHTVDNLCQLIKVNNICISIILHFIGARDNVSLLVSRTQEDLGLQY